MQYPFHLKHALCIIKCDVHGYEWQGHKSPTMWSPSRTKKLWDVCSIKKKIIMFEEIKVVVFFFYHGRNYNNDDVYSCESTFNDG